MRCLVFSLLVVSLLASRLAHGDDAVLNVPFVAQKPNYCGPAALAMLANYYGRTVTQDEIASAIYLPDIGGVLTSELGDYARRFNLWVRQYHGSVDDIRQKLAVGVPVLVLGKFGEQTHFFIVLGWDNFRQMVTVHSDTRERYEMRAEDFLRYWERTGNWSLLVCPPDKATWKLSAEERNDLGILYERMGMFESATQEYALATQLRPDNSYFRMNLGNVLLKQRRLREAAVSFSRAIELDGQNADAMNNLAYAYSEIGSNLDAAVALCQRAVTTMPAKKAYYLDTLGSILLKQDRRVEARDAFEQALAATNEHQQSLRVMIQQHLAAVTGQTR